MSYRALLLVAATLAGATPAAAQSVFDGTWKGNPQSAVLDVKPDQYTLKNGTYTCSSCIPAFSTKADGAFHAVKDRPYWDDVAIKEVDKNTVSYQFRKNGKVVAENTATVSPDGNSVTFVSSNTNNGAGTKVDSTSTETRVGAPVAGAHLISGSWKPDPKTTKVSDNALTMTLKVADGMMHLTSPMGETLDAKIGGDYAANVNDPGKTMTKVEMPSPNQLKMTDMRQGKVVQVSTYTVSADGSTLNGSWMDPRDGSKGTFVAMKQ